MKTTDLMQIAIDEIKSPSYEPYRDTYQLTDDEARIVETLIRNARISVNWDDETLDRLGCATRQERE